MRACSYLCLSVGPQGAVKHSAGNMGNAENSLSTMRPGAHLTGKAPAKEDRS